MSLRFYSVLISIILLNASRVFSQQTTVGHFTLGLQSGVLMPLGANKGVSSEQMGISNALTFKYFPSDYFAMGMTVRVMNNHFMGQSKANDVPITQVPLTFDFEWHPTDWIVKPYIGMGAGLSFFSVKPVGGLINTLKEIPDTYTTPGYLLTGKAGLSYQLSDRFSLTGEGTYFMIAEPGESFLWQQNDGTVYRQFSNKATFTLGIHYHFDE